MKLKKFLILLISVIAIICLFSNVYATDEQEPTLDDGSSSGEQETPSDTTKWTDFSNAEFRIDKEINDYFIATCTLSIVSDMVYLSGHTYDLYINNSTTMPTDPFYTLTKEDGTFNVNVNQFVERAGDIYIWIVENSGTESKTVIEALKVDRPDQNPLSFRIHGYFKNILQNANGTHISFREPHSDANSEREVTIKLGKIDYSNMLNISAQFNTIYFLESVLTYAKADNNPLLVRTLPVGDSAAIITNDMLEKNAFYYVYFLADDVNGTYYPVEDVQIYQVYSDTVEVDGSLVEVYYLDTERYDFDAYFNGDSDDGDDENSSTPNTDNNSSTNSGSDSTTSPTTIPNTGKEIIIFGFILVLFIVIISYAFVIKYRKIK